LMGSIERFFGILIEHYAGAFPTWLAPVQALVLTITDSQQECAAKIVSELKSHGFRVEADIRNEKIGFKIREAEKNKIPYMLVVGDKEVQSGMVSVRGRSGANHGSMPISGLLTLLRTDTNQTLRETVTHSQTR
ncbi:MAG: His/Gly/Thr/Pro-type tRNA ligase C-terminal domain-containing protein, partial [Nitrospirota bacterium]|nr:His/Gly/Thr/Pro-type tRNA ligase C-terminal domain-containing protein [Nitrospirota bacterium]